MILIGAFILGLDLILQVIFRFNNFGLENRGVSFGVVAENGLNISLIVFFIFIVIYFYQLLKYRKISLFYSLIALGGVGNIINRLIWGSVWDYICLPILPFCFNLSDILICIGVLSYILGIDGNRDPFRR